MLSVDNATKAMIGSATVFAGGDLLVLASDDTKNFELSGAIGAGFVGVGASVGVMLINKDTEATIGAKAVVDALANNGGGFIESSANAGIAKVLDGTINGGTSFGSKTTHGIVVQAQSSEVITHIVVAAGLGFVGVSGASTHRMMSRSTPTSSASASASSVSPALSMSAASTTT